jgi:hypothetical protein
VVDRVYDIPERAVIILGAGQFGARAARLLHERPLATLPDGSLTVVDLDQDKLAGLKGLGVCPIREDAVRFLVAARSSLKETHILVPAVPVHLAAEWLFEALRDRCPVRRASVPQNLRPVLPHTWKGSEGSLLVSYADFLCPDDCDEPDYCTVTGERRDVPLYERIQKLQVPGYLVHVIRSRQLAPGVGGYTVAKLWAMAAAIGEGGRGKWLLATACRCHGVISALEIGEGG